MSDDMKIYVVTDTQGNVLKCFYSLLDANDFKNRFRERVEIQLSYVQLAKKRG